MDQREQALKRWISDQMNQTDFAWHPVTGDASFRRYFRFSLENQQYIAVDSPPDKEPVKPFIQIADHLFKLDLSVPKIHHSDTKNGFLIISDLGNRLYHNELNSDNADQLYQNAIHDLLIMQKQTIALPSFCDHLLKNELHLFTEWFLEKLLAIEYDTELLKTTYGILTQNAKNQPQVFIHRDYHSKNLMRLNNDRTGILDFQDAMIGPVTYDLVSLLRDCYIDWPANKVTEWATCYYDRAIAENLIQTTQSEFTQWFDLMGMQRHLKATFIFTRKSLRDQNNGYLQYIPRTLNYINYVSKQYSELADFNRYLNKRILPAWQQKMENL